MNHVNLVSYVKRKLVQHSRHKEVYIGHTYFHFGMMLPIRWLRHPLSLADLVKVKLGTSRCTELGFLFTSSASQSSCNFSWYISEIFKTLIWTCWRYHICSLSGSIACAVPSNFPRNWVSPITEVSLLSQIYFHIAINLTSFICGKKISILMKSFITPRNWIIRKGSKADLFKFKAHLKSCRRYVTVSWWKNYSCNLPAIISI